MENKHTKSIYEHFDDIKHLVLHLTFFFIISFGVSYYFVSDIISFLMQKLLPVNYTLHYFSIIEPFFLQLKIAFVVGIMFFMPFVFLRCGMYFVPVVKAKSALITFCFFGCILFFCGIFLAFEYLIPSVITMMLKLGEGVAHDMPFILHAGLFFGMIFVLLFACGVVLEVPLLMFALVKFNIITVKTLRKFRKFYFVLSFIAGAVFTPPDVLSQIAVAGLMVILFEITLFLLSICKGTKE